MVKHVGVVAALLAGMIFLGSVGQPAGVSKKYKALKVSAPPSRGTWAILDRDGANRPVEPYLSSLGGGESGTGAVVSPAFSVSVDKIVLTVCGHDGQGGGRKKNLIALIDAQSGEVLRQTMAPGSDPMQERSWDVAEFKGRNVRIEVRDGIAEGAFAWIGVGKIDAGPPLRVDFRKGMPDGWKTSAPEKTGRTQLVKGGIPFRRQAAAYTLIPAKGAVEIPCGFRAERLFFLGGTIASGRPLETYGHVEVVYRKGQPQRYPLMYGFTLDGEGKLLSPSKAIHLHPSGEAHLYYFVLEPRAEIIERIKLERNGNHRFIPRITAITCETTSANENLTSLPDCRPDAGEDAWIRSHTISPSSPKMEAIETEIRRAHRM